MNALHQGIRTIRRFFAGSFPFSFKPACDFPIFFNQTRAFAATQTLIQTFYYFCLYLVATRLPDFLHAPSPQPSLLLWPVCWLNWVNPIEVGVDAIFVFFVISTLLAAIYPASRTVRIATFVSWLEYVALENSIPKIGHSLHLIVVISFLFIFLPRGWQLPARLTSRLVRQQTVLTFWSCQAFILLTYTMSGLAKVGGAFYQIAMGQPNAFLPEALARHVAERLWQTDSSSLFGNLIIAHPNFGWPLFIGTLYVQFFSLWIAFRPSLQAFWAIALICFHLSSYFFMTINFPQNCFLLALFFFHSPFVSQTPFLTKTKVSQIFCDLPFFGLLFKKQLEYRVC